MGQLVDGVWKDDWYDTSKTGGRFVRSTAPSATGSRPTARPAPRAKAGSRPKRGAITSTSPTPAPGRTAR
jgi:glutathionyl-hydroquinone reductase